MQIRATRTVSFFPVGLVGNLGVSSPIVRDGKIVGFFDGWIGNRVFAVDMAGFAVNIATLKKAKCQYKIEVKDLSSSFRGF